ncbi:DNA polymerase III subunit delta [Patescibacteria group bacterium]|nr:DNA polymerase III subunit delta [Patescibacteria group bacterium]
MIYFLYGEDDFRIKRRLIELRTGLFKTDANLDFQIKEAANLTAADLNSLVMTQSLLSASKLIVVSQPIKDSSEDLRKGLTELLARPVPDGVVLVFIETQPDQRTKLFKLLNKFVAESYPLLRVPEAKRWLQEQAQKRGVKIDITAVSMLAEDFSDDLWRMSSELDKLATFTGNKLITSDSIEQLTPRPLTDNIFLTIEALAKKNFALANKLINRQLLLGMAEQQLIAMIAYQFRNIVLIRAWLDQGVKPSELPTKTQLHPYVVQKTTELSRQFSISDLSKIFYLLQRVDAAIKKGITPPRVGLDILTAQLVNA